MERLMSSRIIHDIFGRPTLEVDDEKGIVTALRDCTFNLSGEQMFHTRSQPDYIVEFDRQPIQPEKDS
jgi:hypothetical protein